MLLIISDGDKEKERYEVDEVNLEKDADNKGLILNFKVQHGSTVKYHIHEDTRENDINRIYNYLVDCKEKSEQSGKPFLVDEYLVRHYIFVSVEGDEVRTQFTAQRI